MSARAVAMIPRFKHPSSCMLSLQPWLPRAPPPPPPPLHPSFTVCLTRMISHHSTDLTEASAPQSLLISSACLFPLQGKGTDGGPQPNDRGRSAQHSRRQPAGHPRWGLAEHLASERWPQTALWTECKDFRLWRLNRPLWTMTSSSSITRPKRVWATSVLSLTSEMLHRRKKCPRSSSPSTRWSPS